VNIIQGSNGLWTWRVECPDGWVFSEWFASQAEAFDDLMDYLHSGTI
jgi:hypothetical protein